MITGTNLNFFSVFNFLGVFLGLILAFVFIKKGSKENVANIYQGVLLLSLSMAGFEDFLNETGYIVKVLSISNYSEPLNFAFAPLFYLYIKSSFSPEFKKKDLIHFSIAIFWLLYMIFYFIQTDEFKYNSYIYSKHPDLPYLDVEWKYNDNPLGIKQYVNILTPIHFDIYYFFTIRFLLMQCKKLGISFLKTKDIKVRNARNVSLHFLFIILIVLFVKIAFPTDVGDYFIFTYVSFMIIMTAYRILIVSPYFDQPASFMEFPLTKYKKSSLTDETKENILKKIVNEFATKKYYLNNLASLSDFSKIIKESSHHVSQVINERLDMNFFELLAKYRVEEAQRIILGDKDKKITIEELADRVGYNSKSAFNNAFKKHSSQTPSEFRENSQS